MLKVSGIRASYGPVLALHDVSLEVEEGSIVTILGSNGAGKTSTLRVISGLLRASAGAAEDQHGHDGNAGEQHDQQRDRDRVHPGPS